MLNKYDVKFILISKLIANQIIDKVSCGLIIQNQNYSFLMVKDYINLIIKIANYRIKITNLY